MNNKFTLLIIDCQNDFVNKDGSLYVQGSENVTNNIIRFINEHRDDIEKIVLTTDYHPKDHMSFIGNGGEWPTHCVADTWGSEIDLELHTAVIESGIPFRYLRKGEVVDFEEYSASMYSCHHDGLFVLKTATDAVQIPTDNIVVCGVAGDVCVLNTLNDLVKQVPEDNITVLLRGVASLDDGKAIDDFVETYVDVNIV